MFGGEDIVLGVDHFVDEIAHKQGSTRRVTQAGVEVALESENHPPVGEYPPL